MVNILKAAVKRREPVNRRKHLRMITGIGISFIVIIILFGFVIPPDRYAHNYGEKRLPPSLLHLFGTDHLGRDMFYRTMKGLSSSLLLGIAASAFSGLVALTLGMVSGVSGGFIDKLVLGAADVIMGIPHIVLLMLISIAAGRGSFGVAVGIMLTHWPNLTRVIRSEVLEIRSAYYVKAAEKFGVDKFTILLRHILPHVLPQFITGLILLFPHVILHEAAITFLGFGLPIDMPAIGTILSESMNYLVTGMWWLVVYPGAALLIIVMIFETIGNHMQLLLNPRQRQL